MWLSRNYILSFTCFKAEIRITICICCMPTIVPVLTQISTSTHVGKDSSNSDTGRLLGVSRLIFGKDQPPSEPSICANTICFEPLDFLMTTPSLPSHPASCTSPRSAASRLSLASQPAPCTSPCNATNAPRCARIFLKHRRYSGIPAMHQRPDDTSTVRRRSIVAPVMFHCSARDASTVHPRPGDAPAARGCSIATAAMHRRPDYTHRSTYDAQLHRNTLPTAYSMVGRITARFIAVAIEAWPKRRSMPHRHVVKALSRSVKHTSPRPPTSAKHRNDH